MAQVEIAFVCGDKQNRAIERWRNRFDLVAAGRQTLRRAAVRGDGVDVLPAVALPRKRNFIALEPPELRRAHRRIELIADPVMRAPDLMRVAAGCVRDPDRPRKCRVTAAAEARAVVDRLADLRSGRAYEGHARTIRRPRRNRVVRKGGRRAVGRPCYVADCSANWKHFRITGFERTGSILRKRDYAELAL